MSADIATNRKAGRDFNITEKFEAGIELKGTEVKSIRAGKVNISDAFARIENNQIFLYGCNIQPWQTAGEWYNHAEKRPRRLLLHKKEIDRLRSKIGEKGLTLVPLKAYLKAGKVKIELALCKGKDTVDKRETL